MTNANYQSITRVDIHQLKNDQITSLSKICSVKRSTTQHWKANGVIAVFINKQTGLPVALLKRKNRKYFLLDQITLLVCDESIDKNRLRIWLNMPKNFNVCQQGIQPNEFAQRNPEDIETFNRILMNAAIAPNALTNSDFEFIQRATPQNPILQNRNIMPAMPSSNIDLNSLIQEAKDLDLHKMRNQLYPQISALANALDMCFAYAFVLAVLIQSAEEDNRMDETDLYVHLHGLAVTESISEILEWLRSNGYTTSRKRRSRGISHVPSFGLLAFLKTGDIAFLQSERETVQEKIYACLMSWYEDPNSRFHLVNGEKSALEALVEYHDHPLVHAIKAGLPLLNDQIIVLLAIGHELAQSTSMPIADTLKKLAISPLAAKRLLITWQNPDYVGYTSGILQPDSVVNGVVGAIRMAPEFAKQHVPAELMKRENSVYTSKLFDLVYPEEIKQVELHYNEGFTHEIQRITAPIARDQFQAFQARLEDKGLKPSLHIMLSGKPGTGKTELVRQIARESERALLLVNIAALRNKYYGESEKRMNDLFKDIRKCIDSLDHTPIVLFNEADALFSKRSDDANDGTNGTEQRLVGILLNEIEQFEGILMGTTNHTSTMDPAFERRWGFKIEVPMPGVEARERILSDRFPSELSTADAQHLAERYEFSPAQIDNVLRSFLLITDGDNPSHKIEQLIQIEMQGWSPTVGRIGFMGSKMAS